MAIAQADSELGDVTRFVDQFIVAVDFQESVPITAASPLASLPEWDSLAALGVIVMCDTEYNVTITGEDLKACATVGDIFNRMQQKKVG